MPPIGGQAATSPSALDVFGSGGGAPAAEQAPGMTPGAGQDQQRAQLQAFMGTLRDLDQQAQQVFGQMPSLQPLAQQFSQLIKKAAQEAAKAAPQQTGSGMAVPTAGQ